MIAQARADEQQRLTEVRAGGSQSAMAQQDEGYWNYMQRQIQERTEKLGIMGESMQSLESNSSGWADDVSKFVSQQKKNAVTGRKSCLCFPFGANVNLSARSFR